MQTENFVAAMNAIQGDRCAEVGGHLWFRHLERYGAVAYFYELAGIVGRIEQVLVGNPGAVPEDDVLASKLEDLLVDLGNYAGFMYEWLKAKRHELLHQKLSEHLP